MNLNLAISPCPNDTFMFDALLHNKIDTEGLSFKPYFLDIEELNSSALKSEFDVTKLSYHLFPKVSEKYTLLRSGSALGRGSGPLVVSKKIFQNPEKEIKSVAIPGLQTTANFLFSIYFPSIRKKTEILFSEIEDAVLDGKVDAGVIIHEGRFTYQSKGLNKICDLGEKWEDETNLPVPLGGIAVLNSLPIDLREKINRVIRKSIEFAFANPDSSREFVSNHASEMSKEVQQEHINLYVNNYSIDIGEEGQKAIDLFFKKIKEEEGELHLGNVDLRILGFKIK